jgi:hypothetical protein
MTINHVLCINCNNKHYYVDFSMIHSYLFDPIHSIGHTSIRLIYLRVINYFQFTAFRSRRRDARSYANVISMCTVYYLRPDQKMYPLIA